MTLLDFAPPALLRHPDIQNIVSSAGPRAWLLRQRWRPFADATRHYLLDCGEGVRLCGEFNETHQQSKGLVVLLHGWEGSSRSAYVQSAALTLLNAGFNVFRLNFRDHGDSHHLNRELFNSTLLAEVIGALRAIQRQFGQQRYFVAGFSLGGNFALRVALQARDEGIALEKVVAVCPVIDPEQTLIALETARFFYEPYFVRKWRNSLLRKLVHFPDYAYGGELRKLKTLREMHDFFVPRFTGFPDRIAYFNAYTLCADRLAAASIPTLIVNSRDDPITRHDTLAAQGSLSPRVDVELAPYGSHCAFIEDFAMNSWIDKRLVRAFQ